jgi:hypothetical protein
MLRGHTRSAVAIVALLLVAGGLARLSPMWPGPAHPPGATALALATEPGHLLPTMGCPTALLLPARIAVVSDALVLIPEGGASPVDVVWPTGWAAWRLDGRAELVSRHGVVVGREGDVISGFAGGMGTDDAFHVCLAWG